MILITGADGQLGTDLRELAEERSLDCFAVDQDRLDVTDRDQVRECFDELNFDSVINAAAYTAVDRAEEEGELAMSVNRDGAAHLAQACVEHSIPMFQVSTDYVFDGRANRPYREDDSVAPLGVYGRSKWEGEEAVRRSGVDHVILRVSWLFGHGGANFVKAMRQLARQREELRVVADQHGCPTPTRAVADLLLSLVGREEIEWGTYHFVGGPATTWHAFAEAIVEECRVREPIAAVRVVPITTNDYPTLAKRPAYSVLDSTKASRTFGVEPPDWRRALREMLARITPESP